MEFDVTITALGSVRVEANSEKEAVEKAREFSEGELMSHINDVYVDDYAVPVKE